MSAAVRSILADVPGVLVSALAAVAIGVGLGLGVLSAILNTIR